MLGWLRGKRAEGREVVFVTRQGCHLCEEAWAVVERARARHGFDLRQVDVDAEPGLAEQYGECVPVVLVDGRVRFRGRVNAVLLERLFRAGEG